MSGHSKWATIHRAKGIKDAKKGAAFTKLAMAITVAVKQGGGIGDPDQNFKLRLAVDKARQFNMPKENIARAIEKGVGGAGMDAMVEGVFEGFAPGGVAVIAEALTDNKLRTAQQVRLIMERHGGSMGGSGAVAYLFSHLGEIRIANTNLSDEDELKIIDMGVDDIEIGDEEWSLYCNKDKTYEVKTKLDQAGYKVISAELVMRPHTGIEVADETLREQIETILEQLEELDDVQKVWTNYA